MDRLASSDPGDLGTAGPAGPAALLPVRGAWSPAHPEPAGSLRAAGGPRRLGFVAIDAHTGERKSDSPFGPASGRAR